MDPSVCTVVILHQPFIINENDTYQQLLQSYFGQGKRKLTRTTLTNK